jgi:hypothetical protein
MARMTRRTWRRIRAVIIWAAIPIFIWTRPADATLRAAISATNAVFFLLAAPVWCAARNRNGHLLPQQRHRPGTVGEATPTDPRSQRSRASRRAAS